MAEPGKKQNIPGFFTLLLIGGVLVYAWSNIEDMWERQIDLDEITTSSADFLALEAAMRSATDLRWQRIKAGVLERRVTWIGTVRDVERDGSMLHILIDMEPGALLPDVYLDHVPISQGHALERGDTVRFTGRVHLVYGVGAALQVTLSPARIDGTIVKSGQ